MFYGGQINTIDAKGRIVLPPRFRAELGDNFILSRGISESCIGIYKREHFNAILNTISSLNIVDESFSLIARGFVAWASDGEIDPQGRILIPPSLRKFAGLKKNVNVLGLTRFIELWDEETYEKYYSEKCTGERFNQIISKIQF